ncbi:hypothetical protein [Agarilytica rhodophyticola]|uniref:hypothetical protein n=1 Tax=Agarilytica rhodophyticola TaxID=1737490 RepID=UPI0013150E8B|nr:hypothetical protein [Agarilytica rhodophyticola]
MENDEIIKLLKSQIMDADFQNVLSSSDDVDIQSLINRSDFTIYKISFHDLGLNEHDFTFALNENSDKVILLTGSLNNYNEYILPLYSSLSPSNVKTIVAESFLFTRVFYKQFVVLDDLSKAEEWLSEEALGALKKNRYKMDCVTDNEGYMCHVPIVLGRDLILRKVVVKKSDIAFEDRLVVKNASKFFNPHD